MSLLTEETGVRLAEVLERIAVALEAGRAWTSAPAGCVCPAGTVCMNAICPRRAPIFAGVSG